MAAAEDRSVDPPNQPASPGSSSLPRSPASYRSAFCHNSLVREPPGSSRDSQISDGHDASTRQRSGDDDNVLRVSTNLKVNKHLKPPKSFYPLQYGRNLRDFEVWDNTFVYTAVGAPVFTPVAQIPPNPRMLDLGCGYGFWCILAARFFENSQIVGMDMANIQPDLARLGYYDIASRITWVHGDILEKLPFPDCHFDLVRTLHIGFCVPEHKWGMLLREVERVLKPGGIFDTAQETINFPCPRFSPRPKPPGGTKVQANDDDGSDGLADADPRDHSKLRAAFDAMLEVRFLNPEITATLPFYMEQHFENIKMTATVHIMLPPSSFVRDQEEMTSGTAAEPRILVDQHIDIPHILQMESYLVNSESTSTLGGQMHLNSTLNIGLACKEAIWEQFEFLNPTLTRKDFDMLMKNWELDMRDRIDMPGMMKEGLKWECSRRLGDEDPDQKSWRDQTLRFHQQDGMWDAQPLPEYCRSLRAFRGTKRC